MLKEIKDKIRESLILQADYVPYPKIDDREQWENIPSFVKEDYLTRAKDFLNFEWPALPATYFLETWRTGNRVIYEKPHFRRREVLNVLVIAECIENKGRFIDDIINGIWCLCEESYWGVSAHNGVMCKDVLYDVENHYIDLFAGETASLLAITQYLLGKKLDAVSPLICRRIDVEMETRIKIPFLTHCDFWWMGFGKSKVNNWCPWISANVLIAFLLNERSQERRIDAVEKLFTIVDCFLDTYDEDGGCDEGIGYWNVAGGALFEFLEQVFFATDGKIDLFAENKIAEIGRFVYKSYVSGKYFINFADGTPTPNMASGMIYRYGKRIGDETLSAIGAQCNKYTIASDVPPPLKRAIPTLFLGKDFYENTSILEVKKDIWMPNLEVMSVRQCENTEEGFFLAAKGGYNEESHNHNDVGSCTVYYNGQPLLVDGGVGVYTKKTFSESRYSIWTMRSDFHNVPTINGIVQSPGKEFAASNVVYDCKEDRVHFSLDIQNAYAKESGAVKYNRSYDMFRKEKDCIEITDSFIFEKENNDVCLNFMTWQKPVLKEEGVLELFVGSTEQEKVRLSYPKGAKIEFYHQEANDERLYAVWGDLGVSKTTISFIGLSKEGHIKIVLEK